MPIITPSSGGGSASITQEFGGTSATIVPDTSTRLGWATGSGTAALLSLSVPTIPTLVSEGVYDVMVVVEQLTNAATAAIWRASLSADCKITGAANTSVNAADTTRLDNTGLLSSSLALSIPAWIPAGGQLTVRVLHEDSGNVDFAISQAVLTKRP